MTHFSKKPDSTFGEPTIEILSARWTAKGMAESLSSSPTSGPFYAVRVPRRWVVIAFRDDEFRGEPGHAELWIGENGLAAWLSKVWALHVQCSKERLFGVLEDCCYAFPRGRVVEQGGRFRVLHGADLASRMRVTHRRVESLFGLGKRTSWRFDEHECCLRCDMEAARGLLGLEETWAAVE